MSLAIIMVICHYHPFPRWGVSQASNHHRQRYKCKYKFIWKHNYNVNYKSYFAVKKSRECLTLLELSLHQKCLVQFTRTPNFKKIFSLQIICKYSITEAEWSSNVLPLWSICDQEYVNIVSLHIPLLQCVYNCMYEELAMQSILAPLPFLDQWASN